METKIKKDFDAVKFMRQQRDKMSMKLSSMSKGEVVEYFKEKRKKSGIKPSA
jgi:hypothetical protein